MAECITCEDKEPVFTDTNIESFCYVHDGTNQRACELSCTNGGELREPTLKGNEIRCKCAKKGGGCDWSKKKAQLKIVVKVQILAKIDILAREYKFSSKIDILAREYKFSSKIDILVKTENFHQK